jgi:hypothetical protein
MRTEVRLALEAARTECSAGTRQLIDRALATASEEFDPISDVEEFFTKFGWIYTGLPRSMPDDLQRFRLRLGREELGEYEAHVSGLNVVLSGSLFPSNQDHEIRFHLEEMLDAIVDLIYVKIGDALLHGFNLREAWRRVHRQNLLKELATSPGQTLRDFRFDVIKPAGWIAPSHYDLVQNNAHTKR